MTTRTRSSGVDKAVQFTVRFSAAEWELARRVSAILYRGVVRDFVARAVMEKCIAVGVVKMPMRVVPLPDRASSLTTAAEDLAAYQDALARRLDEPRPFFLRTPTRVHLVKTLARFPHGVDEPYEPPRYRALRVDPGDDERPASLALSALQLDAARRAADKVADASLSAFVTTAMVEKAESIGMRAPHAVAPSFAHYPPAELLHLQRNVEEPALALVAAHAALTERLADAQRAGRSVELVRASSDRLLGAILAMQVEAVEAG